MVTLNRIYTRGGDAGQTSLSDGTRVSKTDLRVESYGTVNEANAALGLAVLHAGQAAHALESSAMLARIQNDLFDLGADLATPEAPEGVVPEFKPLRITAAQTTRLEQEIDHMNSGLKPLSSFILPGGTAASAHLHLALTIVRRAERLCVALATRDRINPEAIKFLNRLSDHLFVLARYVNDDGALDVLWVPGAHV